MKEERREAKRGEKKKNREFGVLVKRTDKSVEKKNKGIVRGAKPRRMILFLCLWKRWPAISIPLFFVFFFPVAVALFSFRPCLLIKSHCTL